MLSAALADERPTLHAYRFVPEYPEKRWPVSER